MSTANSPQIVDATIAPQPPSFAEMLASGAIYRHAVALVALAGFITLAAGLFMWASKPSMVPVYNQLSGSEAQQVVDALRTSGIPFEIESGTGLVLAPADQIQQARMKLAAEGIGQTGSAGIEQLQKEQGLGASRFIESARYHHALETELSRTISSMRNVESARVHLALPKQSVFIRDRTKSSASVMVKLMGGRSLESGQVSAIVQLVASSIPHLESSEVTIVDQYGKLFSSGAGDTGMDMANKQFDYSRRMETVLSNRIEQLLSPVLGHGRVRAQVSADLDFSYNEQTQELFDPDQAQIRSEQTDEQRSNGAMSAIGIPGALSNQPPEAADTNAAAGGAKGEEEKTGSVSAQSVRNYELDKTITHSKKEQGSIRRLSVAVLVDNKTVTDENGETASTPLTEDEISTITNIVREAVGYNQARGDTVAVFNQAFQPIEEIEPVEAPPFWKEPWVWSIAKQIIIALVILILAIMLARPAMRNLKPQAAAKDKKSKGGEDDDDELDDDRVSLSRNAQGGPPQLPAPPQAYGDVLMMARGLAEEDPKRVAKVIKNWVEENV